MHFEKLTKKVHSFLVAFGVVLMAPHSGLCAIVYVIIIMAGMAVI